MACDEIHHRIVQCLEVSEVASAKRPQGFNAARGRGTFAPVAIQPGGKVNRDVAIGEELLEALLIITAAQCSQHIQESLRTFARLAENRSDPC